MLCRNERKSINLTIEEIWITQYDGVVPYLCQIEEPSIVQVVEVRVLYQLLRIDVVLVHSESSLMDIGIIHYQVQRSEQSGIVYPLCILLILSIG